MNTCTKISAVVRGLSHTVVNHCLLFGCKASSIIIHHRFWNVSVSVWKIDRKSSPSSTVSSSTKVCDMPRHLRLGLPVNSSHGQLLTHASPHTVNSSQVSTEQSSQSLLLERYHPWPHVANRHLHKPAIIIMTSSHYDIICESCAYGARSPRSHYDVIDVIFHYDVIRY